MKNCDERLLWPHFSSTCRAITDSVSKLYVSLQTPQNGAALFVLALLNWAIPEYKSVGEQMLVLSMWEDNLVAGHTYKSYGLFRADIERVNRLLPPKGHIARSYVAGANPANAYSFNSGSIVVRFRPQDRLVGSVEEKQYKVFIWSGGADSARPVTLKRNAKGYWKVFEFSSLTVDIRAPESGHDAADDL